MIIPAFNTILFSKKYSIHIEPQYCLAISNDQYFCQKENCFIIPNEKLCETQLLNFNPNQTCKPFVFSHSKLIKLTKNSWIFSSPNKITCEIQCNNVQYRKILINTQLIQISPDCTAIIILIVPLFIFESSSKKSINLLTSTIGKLKTDTIINRCIKLNNSLDLSYIHVSLLKQELKLGIHKEQLEKSNSFTTHNYNLNMIIVAISFIIIIIFLLIYAYCSAQFEI